MSDVVTGDCPQCGETIPFIRTVDVLKECPECGTPKDVLFDIAGGSIADRVQVATADGGIDDE